MKEKLREEIYKDLTFKSNGRVAKMVEPYAPIRQIDLEGKRNVFRRLSDFKITHELVKSKSILDVGCHYGSILFAIDHLGYQPAKMVGIEFDENKVNVANKIAKYAKVNAEFATIDLNKDIIRDKFDIVFCLAVIGHLSKPEHLLRQLYNCTKELLIIEGNPKTKQAELRKQLENIGFVDIKLLGYSNDDKFSRPYFSCQKQ